MLVITPEQVAGVVSALRAHSGPVGVDTEYAGPVLNEKSGKNVDVHRAKLVGFSVALSEAQRWYFPLAHQVGPDLNLPPHLVLDLWEALVSTTPWVMHNAKADLRMLARGAPVRYHDTVLLAWLLERGLAGRAGHKLKPLAEAELGYRDLATFEDLAAKRPADQIHPAELEPYAALDAWLTLALFQKWWPDMPEPLRKCYLEVELPLQRELMAMEGRGVQIDQAGLDTLAGTVYQHGQDLAWEVLTLTGRPPTHHRAIGDDLYARGIWQAAGAPRTKGGKDGRNPKLGTGAKALEYQTQVLPEGSPGARVAQALLAHSAQQKLRTTYVPGLRRYSGPYGDGRLRADYKQHGTDTGRFSSSGPMLTLPARSEVLAVVRGLVVAGPGKELWVADYSQLEPRWMAHLAQEALLLEGFRQGKSNYQILMDELGIDKPTAKIMWLGVSYGMGPHRLAHTLRISKEDAGVRLTEFWSRFAGLKRYQETAIAEARRTGYARTLLGRRRHLPDLHHQCGPGSCPLNKWGRHRCGRREAAERQAVNSPIQGSAADTIKLAMLAYARTYSRHTGRIVLQVHDELLVESDRGDDLAGQLLQECMQTAVVLRCPLEAQAHRGRSWLEAKP